MCAPTFGVLARAFTCEMLWDDRQGAGMLTRSPCPRSDALRAYGLTVADRVEMLPQKVSDETLRYLTTKVQRMQHGISVESLRVNTVPSRPTSCPASPSHDHTTITTASAQDQNVCVLCC